MIMLIITLLLSLIFLSPPTPAFASGKLLGEHICQIEVIEPLEVLTWELKNKTVRTYKWCLNVPPRCSEYSHKTVNETKITIMNSTRTVETCCNGFQELNGYCLDVCGHCVNGLCSHDVCLCHPGWQGLHCDSQISINDTQNIENIFNETNYNAEDKDEEMSTISEASLSTSSSTETISIISTDYTQPALKENHKIVTTTKRTESITENISETTTDGKILLDLNKSAEEEKDIDYREFGGESIEISSPSPLDFSKIIHPEVELNDIKTVSANPVKGTYQFTPETLLKPIFSQEESPRKYNSEFSSNLINDENPKKHSSVNGAENQDLDGESSSTGRNLIYSICTASITTVLILIVVISALALKRSRKKIDREKKKEVAAVAVYTTSIFHTPLPEPPSFENPTYINGLSKDTWKRQVESVELNNIQFYPLTNDCQSEPKIYIYDHPPSTGSYRASSEVDALSMYSLSRKPTRTTILDPVYDEIPSSGEYSVPKKSPPASLDGHDNFCLYVNTCGTTKF